MLTIATDREHLTTHIANAMEPAGSETKLEQWMYPLQYLAGKDLVYLEDDLELWLFHADSWSGGSCPAYPY